MAPLGGHVCECPSEMALRTTRGATRLASLETFTFTFMFVVIFALKVTITFALTFALTFAAHATALVPQLLVIVVSKS